MTDKGANVIERLTQVMADVGAVGKNGNNQQQGFKYRAIDDFIEAVHPALVKNGVVCSPYVTQFNMDVRPRLRNGQEVGVTVHVWMIVEYTFEAPDGSKVKAATVGEAADTADKASNKAMSAALKYALQQALMIPIEGTPDADADSPDMGSRSGPSGFEAAVPVPPPDPDSRPRVLERMKALTEDNRGLLAAFLEEQGIPKAPGKMSDEQLAMTLVELRALEGVKP